jgi:metallo-beta-lactamase family protein
MAMHEEVTGSGHIVNVKMPNGETIRFVVDFGLFQEKEYDELNSIVPFNAENIDFCLVTHVHVDHIGRLPLMVRNGFSNSIYATETTCKLLPSALGDSYKVLNSVSKRKNTKCLYREEDVDKTLSLIKPCKYNEGITINDNVKVTFFNNGHLVGAALILVQISYPGYEDINLLFTGDYNDKNIFFDVDPLPKWVLDLPLTIIQESTYGDMDSSEISKSFESNIEECLDSNGTVLALVFSLGRSQEILYILKNMQAIGKLDVNIPIYFDGKLAQKYTRLYIEDGLDIKQELRDFLPENLHFVNDASRSDVLEDTNKKIILTTSGMGSYGPAQTYIPEYITRKDTLIQFTGYTAEGTLGRRLKDTDVGKMVEVGGLIAKKEAKVAYTTEYSAHAKANEMIDFLQQFNNLKLVLVNHGETETKSIFAERILNEVKTKKVGLLGRKYFFRVDSYGLVKTLSTKFE